MDLVHQQIQPEKGLRKVIKSSKEKQSRMEAQYSRAVYPEEYANITQLVTEQHLHSTTTSHLTLTKRQLT
jgi:hypothetical protein